MVNQVVISLGSNVQKEQNLPAAVQLLRRWCQVAAVSSVYETAPVGLLAQPNFFNAAVLIETELDAATLKGKVLGEIERQLQRVRQADKNGPRTIDADIVLFNDAVFDYVGRDGRFHRVPDPDLLRFAHLAVPVAELLPHNRHPETAEPFSALAQRLLNAGNPGGTPPLRPRPDVLV